MARVLKAVLPVIVTFLIVTSAARADLVLTAAGIADGFTLSTFGTMNPGNTGCCSGPFGLAVTRSGTPTVFVEDPGLNKIFTFADVDGQTPATAINSLNGSFGTVGATAVGSTFWGAAIGNGNGGGTFTTYSANLGTVTPQTVNNGATPLHPFLGMATTPSGTVIATTDSGNLVEITPGNPAARVIANVGSADGVSVSPDGANAVIEVGGLIKVYRISDGALLHTYNPGNSPDGTGVIAGGLLNGAIVVAGNNGTLDLIDTLGVITVIATGGTRLDYTAPDANNGSLLIDSADKIYRLSCSNCSIGSTPVPEPASLAIFGTALAGLGLARWRRRRTM